MSKYDDFISELKNETEKQQIPDLKQSIKVKYLNQERPVKNNKKSLKKLIYAFTMVIVIALVVIIPFKNKSTNKTDNIYKPSMPTTVNDTYAFELLSATNIILNNSDTLINLTTREVLEEIANKVHKEYIAIRQMLYSDKASYEIRQSTNENYTDEMIIKLSYNNFDLEYKIYYNKTLKEIDDDEELYDLNGIIIIDNKTYEVIGKTEKEEDEKEFVYAYYQNNKLIQRNTLSIETEKGETEIVIEQVGIENGELKIKNKNNKIEIKVEYPNYEGKIQVVDDGESMEYTFIKEKEIVKIKINKKISNITNKNDFLIVY